MKKVSLVLAAAVLFLLAGAQVRVHAQAAPDGEALFSRADGVRKALLTGTHDELYNSLAPWLRGRAELNLEKVQDMLAEHLAGLTPEKRAQDEKEFLRDLEKADPEGKLGITSFADLQKLSAAKFLALELKTPMLQSSAELKPNRDARWHQVERTIYSATEEMEVNGEWLEVQRTRGYVRFANKLGNQCTVHAVAEANVWQIVDFELNLGDDSRISLSDADFIDEEGVEGNTRDARRAEGEQLLSSARDWSRVQYSKTGEAPKTISATQDLKSFEGTYFRVRDTIYKKPDAERGGLVVEPIENIEDGWGALYFDYASGKSDFKWYETEEALDEALKAFQTEK